MSIFTINGSPVKYGNKWLANGGTPSGELPPYDSSDAGKALVVNNEGDNVEWQIVGSSGVVDQHYDGTSSNAQSGTAVAEALQTVETLPSSSSSDVNKVLTVNNQGEPEWMSAQGGSDIFIADSTTTSEEMYQAYLAGKVLFYKDSTYGMFSVFGKTYPGECSFQGYHASTTNSDLSYGNFVTAFMKRETIYNGHVFPQSNIFSYNLSFHQTRVLDTPALPGNAGKILAVNGTATAVEWVAAPTLSVDQQYSSVSTNAQSGVAVAEAISGVSQVPSSTAADENKVLTVNSSGNAEWATPSGGTVTDVQVNGTSVVSGGVADITVPAQVQSDWGQSNNQSVDFIKNKPGAKPVLAGPGIQITETSNDITISTTTLSGISEIKYVQSLPASPVAGVLYLIPQT